tara:strand:+ start:1432 stop:3390 length:1959 start_codon:yes stop_codon:yes gene_type:complete
MLDLASVFSNLKKQNKIYHKVDYLRTISDIGLISVIFFDKKTLVRLLGGSDYIFENSFQSSFNLGDNEIISVSKLKKLKIVKKAFLRDCKHVLQKNIFYDDNCIGYLFFKIHQSEEEKMDINFNHVYFLSEHFENFIKTFEINLRSKNNERLLGNKMLEIESLIGLTEITYTENENLEGFFQNILLNYISTLNASCGLIFILDENSGSFNVLAELNLSYLKASNKIIRANKGIFKELNEKKHAILLDKAENEVLLEFIEKNGLAGPILSDNHLKGAIVIANKESMAGFIRFNKEDLRLFGSLTKKVSLAFENIKLLDSLQKSTDLVDNIMSSITTGIIKIDLLGEIEYFNNAAQKVFKFDKDNILKNHYLMVFSENHKLISLIEKIEQQGEVIYESNLKIVDNELNQHEINLTISPVFDNGNKYLGAVLAFEDLSDINMIKSTFKKYVSENIVDELLDSGNEISLGGSKNEVCIMFCDIRGFTSMSEKMEPEDVVFLLNNYFQEMIDIVFKNNGTLDKIIGDELMVLYGVPIKSDNDCQKAVNTAIEMFTQLEEFNSKNEKNNLPRLDIGVGINYGEVVSGNIGSTRQMNYTVIGDSVNLAARLCSHAEKKQIVISDSTYQLLSQKGRFIRKKPINVKGKKNKIENWVLDIS